MLLLLLLLFSSFSSFSYLLTLFTRWNYSVSKYYVFIWNLRNLFLLFFVFIFCFLFCFLIWESKNRSVFSSLQEQITLLMDVIKIYLLCRRDRICWLYPLQRGKKSPKGGILGMSLDCIWRSRDSVQEIRRIWSPLHCFYSQVHSNPVRFPSLGQIDLFRNYLYSIRPYAKTIRPCTKNI